MHPYEALDRFFGLPEQDYSTLPDESLVEEGVCAPPFLWTGLNLEDWHKEAISAGVKKAFAERGYPEEAKAKRNATAAARGYYNGHEKKVLCVSTGVIYNSIRDASRDTGVDFGAISHCCRGRRQSAGKLRWAFAK